MRKWYNIPAPDLNDGGEQPNLNLVLHQSSDEDNHGDGILEQSSDSGPEDYQEISEDGVLLQSSDGEVEDVQPRKKRKYEKRSGKFTFLQQVVCARAHQKLYGIGSIALQNLRNNVPAYTMHEKRVEEPKHDVLKVSMKRNSENMKWPQIVTFFWLLYISAAEVLPTKLAMPDSWQIETAESDPDFSERFTAGFFQNLEKHFELCHPGQIGPGTFQGPRRFLEYAKPLDLYMQYTAYADNENIKPASFATFLRVFNKVFSSHLKFREKAEFGQCEVCYKYKMKIKKAKSRGERNQWTRSYSSHLFSQWRDRQFYWRMRELSRQFFMQTSLWGSTKINSLDASSSTLTIIQDGMDQSKLRIPKWGYVRLPKTLEQLYRPALHLAATWAHGGRLFLSISDENVKKNSESQIEQLARALSDLLSFTGTLPLHLHVQSDNCFREAKNQYVATFMLFCVAFKIFRSASQGYLRKSHSHEDVDQVFGQISRLLQGKAVSTANEMVGLLNKVTKRAGTSKTETSQLLRSTCFAYKLDEVANWKNFTTQASISIKGMRHVHYLRFCERKDMGSDILDNVTEIEEYKGGGRYDIHAEDIFLITKRWLADIEISRAMCVMPASLATELRTGHSLPNGQADRRRISDGVKKNIVRYATKCHRAGTLGPDATSYLLQWVQGTLGKHPRPEEYPILQYRYNPELRETFIEGRWRVPARRRIFDVSLTRNEEEFEDDESSSDNGDVVLPQALGV